MKSICLLAFGVLGAVASLAAEDIVTGPPAGTAVSAIACYANSGPYAGRESFDAAAAIGDGPGALLFVHVLNRNTAPVIRGVDRLAREYGLFGFKSFVVTLSDDRTAAEEQLSRVNRSLKLAEPMVLSLDGLDGPGSLALNRRCTLSLIALRDGKVTGSIGFTDTGLYDIERIRTLAEGAIGEVPEKRSELLSLAESNLPQDPAALRALAARQSVELYEFYKKETTEFANSRRYGAAGSRMQRGRAPAEENQRMRRGGNPRAEKPQIAKRGGEDSKPQAGANAKAQRRGGPPEESVLNSLLRSYIRKTNDEARIDSVYADIVKRTEESEDLRKQGIAMFQLMLSFPDRYGTEHAQDLAKQFLKANNAE